MLPNRLTGQDFLESLQNQLPLWLEHVPLNIRKDMWFMQNGALTHWAGSVRNHLNEHFRNKWIGRGGAVSWPARSPDFNLSDFFFMGTSERFTISVLNTDYEQ